MANKNLLCSTGNSARHYVEAWVGGEFGGEGVRVYVWLGLFAVHLEHRDIGNWLHSNTK